MPYFIRIGHVSQNVSGYGQRGYHCFRRGTRVVRLLGAVEAPRTGRVHWRGNNPKEKIDTFPTVAEAKAGLKKRIRLVLKTYSRLPTGKKIWKKKAKV